MFLSNAAVRRPVAICCLIIALFLLGANAYRQMSLELPPRIVVAISMPATVVISFFSWVCWISV